jgi:hypothetical protein
MVQFKDGFGFLATIGSVLRKLPQRPASGAPMPPKANCRQ